MGLDTADDYHDEENTGKIIAGTERRNAQGSIIPNTGTRRTNSYMYEILDRKFGNKDLSTYIKNSVSRNVDDPLLPPVTARVQNIQQVLSGPPPQTGNN